MARQQAKRFRRARTPTLLQMEATECGAAALGIILAYHGRHVPLDELRNECRVSRDGSNALYVKKTAEKYGLISKGYQMTVDELRRLKPPFMVFWELNHFLVVEGFVGHRVYLSDPATGRRSVDEQSFRQSYTGIVFSFEPGPGFHKGGDKPNTGKAILRRMRGLRAAVAYVVLAGLAVMACELIAASYNLIFVDQILIEDRRSWIRPLLFIMGLTALLHVLVAVIQRRALRDLKLSVAVVHSSRFLWHVLRLPITFYQQRYAGDISSRVESNSVVADLISGQLATTMIGLLMVVFYAVVTLAFNPLLTVVGVAIGCLNLAGIALASRLLADESLKIRHDRGKLFGSMMWAVQIIETIKAGASEQETLVRLTGHQTRMTNSMQRIGVANSLLIAMPPLLSLATTAAILWIGGARVIDGVMSVGALVAMQTLMANLNRPFGDLVRLGSSVQSLQAELARLDDVHQYPLDPRFETTAAATDTAMPDRPALSLVEPKALPRRLRGHVELRNLTFGYRRTIDEPLISDFSLEIQPGSRVALVGTSGSGKSTIGRLATGLYRPWSGEVLYDGMRSDEIPREVFTDQVAVVDDQTFLFSGTIRENLTLWDETIAERDISRAAIDAVIHRDLIDRRGGYHARLAEAARNFSGGQRQRIEIARALVRNPAFLVLDEATSALDPLTEVLVDDNLRRRGCTCLIIAHRLSTIRDCDEIIVLHQGRVVQRGTHDQLMDDVGGYYHELQSVQAEGGEGVPAEEWGPGRSHRANGRFQHADGAPINAGDKNGQVHQAQERQPLGGATTEVALLPANRNLVAVLDACGQPVTTAGNLPLALDDASAVWRITSGQVDVFYVEPSGKEHVRGRRRHLCRVEEGGSIFGLGEVRGERRGELLAVGVGQARLLKFPRAELVRLALDSDCRREVAEMIDDWVGRLSRSLDAFGSSPAISWLESNRSIDLQEGQSVGSRSRVLWVRPAGERFRLLGSVNVFACPNDSRFPLTPHSWVTLEHAGQICPMDTETLMENGDPWVGLNRYHTAILDALAQARVQEGAYRYARLAGSGIRDELMVAEALSGLSGLCGHEQPVTTARPADEPLLETCRLVGRFMNLEVKPPPRGETGESLRQIARVSGFRTRRIQLEDRWWNAASGPLLGFLLESGRPVALLPATGSGYVLEDRARGVRVRVTDEVARTLQPTAVMFYRTISHERPGGRELVRFCLPSIRGELRTLLVMGLFFSMLGVVAPVVTATVIDEVIPRADRTQLTTLCIFLVSIGLSAAAFQTIQGLAMVRLKGKLEAELLPAVWDRLLNLPTRFFSQHESGDLALRAMGMGRLIEVMASTSAASLLVGIFSLSSLAVLFVINWKLAIIATGLIAVYLPITLATLPTLWRLLSSLAQAQGKISALLLVLLGGIARLRVAGAEKRAFARWAEQYRNQLDVMLRFQRIIDRLFLFSDVWPMVVLMVVFATINALGPTAMSTGEFLAFNMALAQGMMAVVGLSRIGLPLLEGLEQYERLRPILETTPELMEVQGETVTLGGSVRLSNVSFRYADDGPLVLDAVNLQVRPGEFVAVVGPSGSGKSTLMRLMLGFETPLEGVIAFDGRELAALDIQEVRRQIGVVLQDSQLLPGDILSNIVGLSSSLSKADAWEAAELAGLAEDIENMPMGMHTMISEGGGGLSSGQRQRLIIARALANRPKILILDEATSALDNRTQALVSRNVQSRLKGTSRLVIAHRLSTIVDADRIYVLSRGKIVQSGTYSQLMREPGPFQELARRQMLE